MDLDTENALIWGGEMMTFDVYTADLEVRWRARRMAPPQNSIKVPGIPVGLKNSELSKHNDWCGSLEQLDLGQEKWRRSIS